MLPRDKISPGAPEEPHCDLLRALFLMSAGGFFAAVDKPGFS